MQFFKTDAGKIAGIFGAVIGLIFGAGAVKHYCGGSKKSDIIGWILLLLSIGFVIFFLLYGSTKDPETALTFKVYGMILASFFVILSITSVMLKRKSVKQDEISKQKQQIHSLKINVSNLDVKLSIIKRSIDWSFNHLYYNAKVDNSLLEKHLIQPNKKFCDFFICCRIIKVSILSVAMLIFLYQCVDGLINKSAGFGDLFVYCILVTLFVMVFVVDQLMVYYSNTEYELMKKENKTVIEGLSLELASKKKKYDSLVAGVEKYNRACDDNSDFGYEILLRRRNKVLSVLDIG